MKFILLNLVVCFMFASTVVALPLPAFALLGADEIENIEGISFVDRRRSTVLEDEAWHRFQAAKDKYSNDCGGGSSFSICQAYLYTSYDMRLDDIATIRKAAIDLVYLVTTVTGARESCISLAGNAGDSVSLRSNRPLSKLVRAIARLHDISVERVAVLCDDLPYVGSIETGVSGPRGRHPTGGGVVSASLQPPTKTARDSEKVAPDASFRDLDVGALVSLWATDYFPAPAVISTLKQDKRVVELLVVGARGVASDSWLLKPWEKLHITVLVTDSPVSTLHVSLEGQLAVGFSSAPPPSVQYDKDIWLHSERTAREARDKITQLIRARLIGGLR